MRLSRRTSFALSLDGFGFEGPGFGGFGFDGPASRWMRLFRLPTFVGPDFDGPASSVGVEGSEPSSIIVWASCIRTFEGPAVSSLGGSGSEGVASPDLSVAACVFLQKFLI